MGNTDEALGFAKVHDLPVPYMQRWSDDPEWKLDFQNIERIPKDEIQRRRSEFDRIKKVGQKVRDDTLAARNQ